MTEPVSGSSLLQAQDVQRANSHNHVHHNTHTRHHIRSHHQHKALHQRQKEEAAEQQRQQDRQQEEESRELPQKTQSQSQLPSPSSPPPPPPQSQSQVRNQTLPQSQPVTPPPQQQQQPQPEEGDSSIVRVVHTVDIVQLIDATGATVGVETFTSLPTTTSFVNSQHPAPASLPLPEATSVSSSLPKVAAVDPSLPEATPVAGQHKAAALEAVPSDDAADVPLSIPPTTAPSVDLPASIPMSPFPTVESFAKITSTPSSGYQPVLSFSGSGVLNSTISSTTTQRKLPSLNLRPGPTNVMFSSRCVILPR